MTKASKRSEIKSDVVNISLQDRLKIKSQAWGHILQQYLNKVTLDLSKGKFFI